MTNASCARPSSTPSREGTGRQWSWSRTSHWADGATLDILTFVGRRIAPTHTLLLLTFREVPPDHPLSLVLGDLPAARVGASSCSPPEPAGGRPVGHR